MGKSVGERIAYLEQQLAATERVVATLDSRVRYLDAIQRAWIDREGVEVIQKMVFDYTSKIASTKMAEIRAKVDDLTSSKAVALSLEVGPRSIVVIQVELGQGAVPELQLVLAERAAPLLGAKVGDLVGKNRILEIYDRIDGVAHA